MTTPTGTADLPPRAPQAAPAVVLDGPILRRTLAEMEMSEAGRGALRLQASALITRVVAAYEGAFGSGDVGAGGSALAGGAEEPEGLGPTGLLYGRIQSGKTAAMITSTAIALDNGFRIVVVLTTNFVELVRQTKERFDSLASALVHASTEHEEWSRDLPHIQRHMPKRGLVLVCAKDSRHLEKVSTLLSLISAERYPAIILDDEADQASLDNNVRKRSGAPNPEEVPPTKIADQIRDLRKQLRRHVFLQVTATPYALFLQNVVSPDRPAFVFLLEPGEGYCGGELFFADDIVGDEDALEPAPPLRFVPEDESAEMQLGAETAPSGLEHAITYFLVAAAAQALADSAAARASQNFLCHTSHKKVEHDRLHNLIVKFLSTLEDELLEGRGRATQLVAWAYDELGRTLAERPALADVTEHIVDRLPRRKIRVVNSEGKSTEEARGAPNFIVGGNIVGRGLTIPNLLVTYYLRKPQTSQMDTMLQHARMFGYRQKLMAYSRVFLPQSLALRFNRIHSAEAELRTMIPNVDVLDTLPVEVVGELRPTRYGVLDPSEIQTVRSGHHIYPTLPDFRASKATREAIERLLSGIFGVSDPVMEVASSSDREVTVEIDRLVALVRAFDGEDESWDTEGLCQVLQSTARRSPHGYVRWRTMRRKGGKRPELSTGAASGTEVSRARSQPGPTLFVFRQEERNERWGDQPFWYPTLVFPSSMPNKVYNRTTREP